MLPPFGTSAPSLSSPPMLVQKWALPCAAQTKVSMSVLYYNSKIAGVDSNGQLRTYYPVGRNSMK